MLLNSLKRSWSPFDHHFTEILQTSQEGGGTWECDSNIKSRVLGTRQMDQIGWGTCFECRGSGLNVWYHRIHYVPQEEPLTNELEVVPEHYQRWPRSKPKASSGRPFPNIRIIRTPHPCVPKNKGFHEPSKPILRAETLHNSMFFNFHLLCIKRDVVLCGEYSPNPTF